MKELPKAYEPKQYEDAIYKRWEDSGFFNPDVCVKKGVTDKNAEPFSIVLPPPNVTGTLHIGHAAMLAIEDLMIRYHRMKGDKTLWIPGTDSAAIATQSKVEKMLLETEGKTRHDFSREKFLKKVDQFAQESHDTIVHQLKKMGSSLDWSREAFTLDEPRVKAVYTVFKKMYDDGLIYRGYRVVNWSVKGQSTCSDDELVHVERPATLYYFKYSKDFPITIATTRPETKLGDTAVAVHPKGKWKKYIGKSFMVENFGQSGHTLEIKIIGDDSVDDLFGTGALGVTPAHSMVDFEMYQKQKAAGNDIQLIQVIGEDGRMTENAGSAYAGVTAEEARKKVVKWLDQEGLLEKSEEITHSVGTSDRFHDVVEPLPKTQWFVDVNAKFKIENAKLKGIKNGKKYSLKELMQGAVRSGEVDIIPDRFQKTYFHWIDNLRDWCISRQIWYGHRIPVWYRHENMKTLKHENRELEMYVGVEGPDGAGWEQDPDTLDTWFSSGLWTFSTLLGEDVYSEDLKKWFSDSKDSIYHPTTVLETGYDILFFWVARMILMSTYVLGEVPFKTVYLHGLVRDEEGRKMSKSLGNVINPLDTIEKYGADATRLSLIIGNTPGTDLKLSEAKVEGFRNFANKLWNISRFIGTQITDPQLQISQIPTPKTLADEWILSRSQFVIHEVTKDIEEFRFSMAGEKLRDFTWGELADWYLEIAKIEGEKSEMLNYLLNTILKLWHPFMPFVTEAIWQEIYGKEEMLMVSEWPEVKAKLKMQNAKFDLLKDVIVGIRSLRAEKNIPPKTKLVLSIKPSKSIKPIQENEHIILHLARLESILYTDEIPAGSVGIVQEGVEAYLHLSGAVDVSKEKERLQKEIDMVEPYVISLGKKLKNKEFVKNAPKPVVDGEKKKLDEAKEKLEKLQEQIKILK